jgi:predicted nucleotidyltransferase component of viral defense system
MMVMGIYMSVVSVEDLILSKLIWIQQVQSQKQMEDISGLLRDASPDLHYLKEWITKLNIDTFGLL